MKNQHRWIKITAMSFLGVDLLVVGVYAVVSAYPGLTLLARPSVKSRSPFCTVWQAIPGMDAQFRDSAMARRIERQSSVLRREGDLTLLQTPSGEFWVPRSDEAILPILLAQTARGIYESGDLGVRQGDVVLDVGAYVGTYTRHALGRGAKLVVAIEPSPASVECLRRNLAAEIAAGKVVIYPKGIWDSEDSLPLFVNPNNTAGNSFLPFGEKFSSIPVTTIAKLSQELNLSRIDFIKADVKGATGRLLRGGSEIIARDRPQLALSTEEDVDDAGMIAALVKRIQPAYDVKPGPCMVGGGSIYTDVLFFR